MEPSNEPIARVRDSRPGGQSHCNPWSAPARSGPNASALPRGRGDVVRMAHDNRPRRATDRPAKRGRREPRASRSDDASGRQHVRDATRARRAGADASRRALRAGLRAPCLPQRRRAGEHRRLHRRDRPRLPCARRGPAAAGPRRHGAPFRRLSEEMGPARARPQHRSSPRPQPADVPTAPGRSVAGHGQARRLLPGRSHHLHSASGSAAHRHRGPGAGRERHSVDRP